MKSPFQSRSLAIVVIISFYLIAVAIVTAPIATANAGLFDVVATDLDNPRDIIFDDAGAMYVAEAGRGGFVAGPTPALNSSGDSAYCFDGPEGFACTGYTGAITKVEGGVQERIVADLPSYALEADGSGAIGPHGLGFDSEGNLYTLVGLGAPPDFRLEHPSLEYFGYLMQVVTTTRGNAGGSGWIPVMDVAAYEATANPDGGVLDSNPFYMTPYGDGFAATDAGGNALLSLGPAGDRGTGVATLAVFPDVLAPHPFTPTIMIPMNAVPTGVTTNADSNHLVGQLTGFPFPDGGANVFEIVAGSPVTMETGFTNILDIDYGADGSIYVLEMDDNGLLAPDGTGVVTRIHPDGFREVLASTGLVVPTGMALGPDGAVYVSNFGPAPAGVGQVVRIPVQPTDVNLSSFGSAGAYGFLALTLLLGIGLALLLLPRWNRSEPQR